MKTLCRGFYAVIPEIRTDFQAIPSEGTDQNYIDRWLEKQKKAIQEKYSVRKLASKPLLTITAPDKNGSRVERTRSSVTLRNILVESVCFLSFCLSSHMYIYIYTRVSVVKCSNKTNFLRDSIRL